MICVSPVIFKSIVLRLSFEKLLLFVLNYEYVLGLCILVQAKTNIKRRSRILEAGLIGTCEPSVVGPGN